MEFLFPLHPRLVHFSIALSLVGAVCSALGLLYGRHRWHDYGRVSLLLGWIATMLAGLSGLVDQNRAGDWTGAAGLISQHISVGVALIIVLGAALYWPLRDKRLGTSLLHTWGYTALLLLVIILVLLESWLGGKLVYQWGLGVR